ncbi:hypothetical protein [Pseudomonas lundensis]|uniref:hypothetical protein n=1 Tax=Pseudomonas lundensis TaxID=86185 RepID=UPI0014746E5B|nr:hypothetical protein [Pseudomonas lundensis]NNA30661.1 hypothetical protein [Pseudomonas lundensis]
MEHEIVVEGFVLQVEVTHCVNEPPCPGSWNSDWDAQGCRELEFVVVSGITYDADGVRMDASAYECYQASQLFEHQIEAELWRQIDSRPKRQRWAA